MKLSLAALGFTATIAQLVLMRELVATFYGNELLFGLVLMVWMAWVAIGSWGLGRLVRPGRSGKGVYAVGLAGMGAILTLQLALVRGARQILGVPLGASIDILPMVLAILVILAPLCLLGGWLFTLGARLAIDQGFTAGQAYVWESVGAVSGGGLFSFVLIHWLNPFQTALAVLAMNLTIVAQSGFLSRRPAHRLAKIIPPGLLVVLLLLSIPVGHRLHQVTLGWQWKDLIFESDSPYGRIAIQKRDSQRIFFENGLLAFETQGTFPEEVVHFPLLSHPDPKDVLLIGGGIAGDLGEILKHPVEHLTYVELDPTLIEAAKTYLPPEMATVLDDPRVSLALTDGRLYIQGAAPQSFDAIILDLPDPATGALNRFYTQEFFLAARRLLKPGGILATGLPSTENYWSPELARRNASIYWTLKAVFPEEIVLPGEHNFFLASDLPLQTDPTILTQRLKQRGIETRRVTPEYIRYVLTTDRFTEIQRQLESTRAVRINTDLAPVCYYYDLVLWITRFYPDLGAAFSRLGGANGLPGWGFLWAVVPWLVIVAAGRLKPSWTVPIIIAETGLAQMTLEIAILFAFQVLHGSLYAEVSLIVTAFMGGLALGGALGNRWGINRNVKKLLLAIQGAVMIYSLLFPLVLRITIPVPGAVFPCFALLAGGITGMAFPLAVKLAKGMPDQAVGMLYGADLVGGCLGALVGAAFLIPLIGIPQTCWLMALVGLAGLLILV